MLTASCRQTDGVRSGAGRQRVEQAATASRQRQRAGKDRVRRPRRGAGECKRRAGGQSSGKRAAERCSALRRTRPREGKAPSAGRTHCRLVLLDDADQDLLRRIACDTCRRAESLELLKLQSRKAPERGSEEGQSRAAEREARTSHDLKSQPASKELNQHKGRKRKKKKLEGKLTLPHLMLAPTSRPHVRQAP